MSATSDQQSEKPKRRLFVLITLALGMLALLIATRSEHPRASLMTTRADETAITHAPDFDHADHRRPPLTRDLRYVSYRPKTATASIDDPATRNTYDVVAGGHIAQLDAKAISVTPEAVELERASGERLRLTRQEITPRISRPYDTRPEALPVYLAPGVTPPAEQDYLAKRAQDMRVKTPGEGRQKAHARRDGSGKGDGTGGGKRDGSGGGNRHHAER